MARLKDLIDKRYGGLVDLGDGEVDGPLAQFLSRRSIRRFRDEPVPESLLDILLACAQSAPTKSNLQQYSMVVIRDRTQREALAPLCKRTKGIENVPVLVAFCADMRRGQRLCVLRGHVHANNNMDTFHNAVVDAALAMGFFVAAAEAAGLGCTPLSSMRDEPDGVARVLGLPPGVFCIAGVMAGWPAEPGYINQRLPMQVVVHRDRYEDSDLEAQVDRYDRMRQAIAPIAPEKQRYADRFGVVPFCGWSENAARQLGVPERANFTPFLKSHGFALD